MAYIVMAYTVMAALAEAVGIVPDLAVDALRLDRHAAVRARCSNVALAATRQRLFGRERPAVNKYLGAGGVLAVVTEELHHDLCIGVVHVVERHRYVRRANAVDRRQRAHDLRRLERAGAHLQWVALLDKI